MPRPQGRGAFRAGILPKDPAERGGIPDSAAGYRIPSAGASAVGPSRLPAYVRLSGPKAETGPQLSRRHGASASFGAQGGSCRAPPGTSMRIGRRRAAPQPARADSLPAAASRHRDRDCRRRKGPPHVHCRRLPIRSPKKSPMHKPCSTPRNRTNSTFMTPLTASTQCGTAGRPLPWRSRTTALSARKPTAGYRLQAGPCRSASLPPAP